MMCISRRWSSRAAFSSSGYFCGRDLSDTTTDVSDEVPPRMLGGEDECAPMTVAARTRRMNWPDMVRAGWIFWVEVVGQRS